MEPEYPEQPLAPSVSPANIQIPDVGLGAARNIVHVALRRFKIWNVRLCYDKLEYPRPLYFDASTEFVL